MLILKRLIYVPTILIIHLFQIIVVCTLAFPYWILTGKQIMNYYETYLDKWSDKFFKDI